MSKQLVIAVVIFQLTFASEFYDSTDYMKREHSLVRPYYGSGMAMPHWDFVGSTMVTPKYIRLTPDAQSKRGGLWNSVPVASRNWEFEVHFKVHGNGKDLFGDGFAIWYTKDRLISGPVFGSKDLFSGLALMLDTYSNQNGPHNHPHPYISAMVNNGTMSYDHDRDGTHTQIAGCHAKFRNVPFDTIVSVRYQNDVLTVKTDMEGKREWKDCFEASSVLLPTGYFIGLTAVTGDLSDNHDIISVKFYELESSDAEENSDRSKITPSAAFFEAPRDHVDDPKPSSLRGLKMFLLIVVGVAAVVGCVILGLYLYHRNDEISKQRSIEMDKMLAFSNKTKVNKEYRCMIRLLDEQEEILECDFQGHHKGQYLMDQVCCKLNLMEKDYFGLRYVDDTKQRHWLDPTKNILKQVQRMNPIMFSFRVKYYPKDPFKLREELTRYHIFLQLRRDLLHGRLYCSFDESAELGAFIVQSEIGDYDPDEHGPSYLADFRIHLKQSPELMEKIEEIHRHKIVGQVPATAESNFLKKASQLDTYGIDPHPVKDANGAQLYLGINHSGLLTFQGSQKTNHFRWTDIKKLNYEGKMFIVHLTYNEVCNNVIPHRHLT
ncbi:unnamed protein product [Notodromas monacha]|uniref:Uncharacterized protein n=1 Tax=Notodromas monacha TaxID=399045 RepID=A0A7R9GHC6_9CRUS|nr:unnamed protein product [Notodromas monacha]CAG0920774.1 unnamed protein product [Notodromas monacha]